MSGTDTNLTGYDGSAGVIATPPARTARDIIQRSFRMAGVLGVGQTSSAADIQEGVAAFNDMLALWSVKRWLIYHLLDVWVEATGQPSYGVGPGADFNINRPNRIEAAFFRQTNVPTASAFVLGQSSLDSSDELGGSALNAGNGGIAIDFPLELLESREDWNNVSLKGMRSFGACAFYDSGYPIGTLYVSPVMTPGYEIHISVRPNLPTILSANDVVTIPPEYGEAINFNLAQRLRLAYGLPIDPGIQAFAQAGLQAIRAANTQIPQLLMPGPLRTNWQGNNWVVPATVVSTNYFIVGRSALGGGGVYAP